MTTSKLMMKIKKYLDEIETACNEIAQLLTIGSCQKFQVLTEVEIILENLNRIKQYSDDDKK